MTLYTVNPADTLTSIGSGYTNNSVTSPVVTIPVGALRTNATRGLVEIWDGKSWTPFTDRYESRYITGYIEKAESEVRAYVNTHASDNITINDALSEWIGACERFKVIVTLAEHSK
jgi:hypothetical protein